MYFLENLCLKIETSEITSFFYNNFFRFGGGGFKPPKTPCVRHCKWQVLRLHCQSRVQVRPEAFDFSPYLMGRTSRTLCRCLRDNRNEKMKMKMKRNIKLPWKRFTSFKKGRSVLSNLLNVNKELWKTTGFA